MTITHRLWARAACVILTSVLVAVAAAAIAGCGGDKYVGTWKVTTDNGKPSPSDSDMSFYIHIKKLSDKYEVTDSMGSGAPSGMHIYTKEGGTIGYSSAATGAITISVSGNTLTLINSSTGGGEMRAVRQ